MKKNYSLKLFLVCVISLLTFGQTMAEELPAAYNKAVKIPQMSFTSAKAARIEMPESYFWGISEFDRDARSFTLATWVNMDQITNEGNNKGNVIMGHCDQKYMTYDNGFALAIDENGKLKTITGGANSANKVFDTTVELNQWVYLALSYSTDTHELTVYKNAELVGSVNNGGQLLLVPDKAVFFLAGAGFSGLCDELQYFDKALTAEEITQAYDTPEGMENLKAWYTFEEWADGKTTRFINKVDETAAKADLCVIASAVVGGDGGYTSVVSNTNSASALEYIGVESTDGRYIPSAINEVEVSSVQAYLYNGRLFVPGLSGHNVIKVVSLLGQVQGIYETDRALFEVELNTTGKVFVVAIESENGNRTVCKVVDCK